MKKTFKGFLACALAVMMVLTAFSGVMAKTAEFEIDGTLKAGETASKTYEAREASTKTLDLSGIRNGKTFKAAEVDATPAIQPNDIVTIMVELPEAPAADVMSDLRSAGSYRDQLVASQNAMIKRLNQQLNINIVPTNHFSVLFNGFAFDGEYRLVAEIDAIEGVHAFVSPVFEEPELFNTTTQVGAVDAWELGYTGAGYTVAIIDTGCRVSHPAFSVEPDEVQFTRDDIAAVIASGQLHGTGSTMNVNNVYVSAKIPFQWNYEYNHADASHPGSSDHGTHVAGIAAGNGGEIQGVAKDAQIAVMQVFRASGGAPWTNILPALEDCAVLGVSAANLSLGSPNGEETPYDPSYVAILDRCVNAGVNLAMAAGNDYDSTFNNAWGGNYEVSGTYTNSGYGVVEDVDFGVVGSPSSWTQSLSVAAVNNTKQRFYYITVDGVDYSYSENAENAYQLRNVLGGQTVEYVMVPGFGTPEDFAQVDVQGKVALVSRGEINFVTKAENAENAGAVACIVYNNVDEAVNMVAYEGGHIPHVIISRTAGAALAAAENKVMYIGQEQGVFDSPSGDHTTSFSSRGLLTNMGIKPEITAPGGSIYSSTDPSISGTWYATWDGTSMATPHVCGGMAIVTEYVDVNFPNLSNAEKQMMVDRILMSTATPIVSDSGEYAPVHEQGAGRMNLTAATTTKAYLTVEGTQGSRPKLELGDDPEKTGAMTMTFKVHNFGDTEQVYAVVPTVTVNDIAMLGTLDDGSMVLVYYGGTMKISGDPGESLLLGDANGNGRVEIADAVLALRMAMGLIDQDLICDMNGNGTVEVSDVVLIMRVAMGLIDPMYSNDPGYVDFDMPETVTVPAGGEATVTVSGTLNDAIKDYLDTYYTSGALVEGFIELVPENEDDVTLSVPFVKFYGDWNYAATIDRGYYYQDEGLQRNSNNFPNTIGWKKGNTIYGLGVNPYVETEDMSYYLADRNAISPNADGIMDTVNVLYTGLLRNSFVRYVVLDANGNEIDQISNLGNMAKGFWDNDHRTMLGVTEGTFPGTINFANFGQDEIIIRVEAKLANDGAHGTAPFSVEASENYTWDTPVSIDVNKPVASNVTANGSTLTFDVTDDRYVAYVATYEYRSESELGDMIDEIGLFETTRGAVTHVTLDAASQCYVLVCDYAMNEQAYLWNGQTLTPVEGVTPGEPVVEVPVLNLYCYGSNLTTQTWLRFSTADLESLYYGGGIHSDTGDYTCGTWTGEYVYAIGRDGTLIRYEASDVDAWGAKTTLGTVQSDYTIHEMAYDRTTDKLYVVAGVGELSILNPSTCTLTPCADPEYGIVAIDFDVNGNCYIVDAYGDFCSYDIASGTETRVISETGVVPLNGNNFFPQCGCYAAGCFFWFAAPGSATQYSEMHLYCLDVNNGAYQDLGAVYGGLYCLGMFANYIEVAAPTVNHEDFYDNFDGSFNWETVDADGDGLNWGTDYFDNGQYYDGAKCAVSYSYTQEAGAFTPDNWMISPEFTVGDNRFLSFYTSTANYSATADWDEHYAVYVIPAGGSYEDGVNIFETTMDTYLCTEHVIDLSAFAGQTIQLAFRHFNCYDEYTLLIDAVSVGTHK